MSTPVESQQPSPQKIFEALNAYQQTAALKTAIELDLFTAIGEGKTTARALGARCRASERGVRILADYLTVRGFLTKEGSQYGLTLDSATFLDRRSPAYQGSITGFLCDPGLTQAFDDLTGTVRRGGTLMGEEGTVSPENPVWVKFARAMAPMMVMPAEMIAKLVGAESSAPWKVLDIAAGHGLYGIAIARKNPQAQVAAVDWAGVLEVAKENARTAGVAARYSTIAGDAFKVDFGSGYDLVLLTNFLHHFDFPTCVIFLRKVRAALRPGGRAVTLEFIPNDDRVSPPIPAAFSMIMLGTTRAGDAYTASELGRMFGQAGFTRNEFHPLPPTPQTAVISS